jgi:hypothetical protein
MGAHGMRLIQPAPHQRAGSWIPAVVHPLSGCWLSSKANNKDIQQLVPVQALLSKAFQGVCCEYRVACHAPIS